MSYERGEGGEGKRKAGKVEGIKREGGKETHR